MKKTLQDYTRQLLALSKSAAEEKILPQEIILIQEKAFQVQEEMMAILEKEENEATDIRIIQNTFQIREDVWDIMNSLAIREAEIKNKFGLKDKPTNHKCCCKHSKNKDTKCECNHKNKTEEKKCCCKNQKSTTSKCCTKKENKTCRKK